MMHRGHLRRWSRLASTTGRVRSTAAQAPGGCKCTRPTVHSAGRARAAFRGAILAQPPGCPSPAPPTGPGERPRTRGAARACGMAATATEATATAATATAATATARGSAVCGRGADASGAARRQRRRDAPAAPGATAAAGGSGAAVARITGRRDDANCNDAGCADAAGRPNGDAASRRTAEVGRGLVGGCGSRPRPCSCTSRSRAWTPHDNHMITGWRHMWVAGWSQVVTGWG